MAQQDLTAEAVAARVALNTKEVLNFNEACTYTGMSKSAMYKLTCYKEIPHYKPTGKLVFFNRKELESWLQQNRQSTTTELADKAQDYCSRNRLKVRSGR